MIGSPPSNRVPSSQFQATGLPSHGLTEPWRFTVFRGDSRQTLAEAMQSAYQNETPEAEFRPEKFEKLGKNPLCAHAVAAVIVQTDPTGKIPELEDCEAVACAVQNLHLAATALDIGVFCSSPPFTYGQQFADFLQLQPGQQCLGVLYIGRPKPNTTRPTSKRRPAMDKVRSV